jgi:23S rRNA (uracil1939-C5)-methyltransferase
MPSRPDASVDLAIDSLAVGGDGVGRGSDGRVVFVPWTAPGDRVRVRLVETRRRFARGELLELLEPSADRVEPRCPVFGACGGCTWQHLRYDAQLAAKRTILRDALTRIGGLELAVGEIPFVASPQAYAYRLRTRVQREAGRVGYLRRGSRALCPITHCPILVPELDALLPRLAQEPGDAAAAPGARRPDSVSDGPGARSELELVAGRGGATRVCRLPWRGRKARRIALPLAHDGVNVSPGVFTQANAFLLEPLAAAVHEAAGAGRHALELFAGAGFLTLGLARRFEFVTAVESDAAALRDLRYNLRAARLVNVECLRARVERALERKALQSANFDAVALDPPRSGLPRGVAERIASLGAPRIAYLSCDPATLARDAAILLKRGYHVDRVVGFDLFPQTAHVEALLVLELR